MNVELIVDSTVDVPERVRSRLTVVPLTCLLYTSDAADEL